MNGDKQEQLRSLMKEALETCRQLRDYSKEKYATFARDDDEILLDALDQRDKMIEALADIDSRIDDIVGNDDDKSPLPPDVEQLRRSVRAVLDDIAARDLQTMKLVSDKMQKYKVETLKARSRQSFSAYMRSVTFGQEVGDGLDLLN